jgi:hypothetical protein
MGYAASASHAEASAVPQATAANTYFVFGNDANLSAATDQSLTATPTATAVAATGGGASAIVPGAQALSPGTVPGLPGGLSTTTVLLIAGGALALILIMRRF